jgi:hypothetical protein
LGKPRSSKKTFLCLPEFPFILGVTQIRGSDWLDLEGARGGDRVAAKLVRAG